MIRNHGLRPRRSSSGLLPYQRMRVAYFSETLPPHIDGATRTIAQLVQTLEEQKVGFRFYSGVEPHPELPWRDQVYKVASLPFLPYDYYRFAVPFFQRLRNDLDRFAPELIHAVNPTPLGIWAAGYGLKRQIPVVASFHTDFVSYLPYYGLGGLERIGWNYLSWFYGRCAVTYAPSRTTAAVLEEHGVNDVELWQRGIDGSSFSPIFRSHGLRQAIGADHHPVLLFVGRLVREKNLDDLVDAVHLLAGRGHRFKLVMVGGGPMEGELRERLPDAHFAGYQRGESLSRWYASSDALVFPSTTETFGNVVLEAFASGLPAVGVARGGVQDLIDHGRTGFLARPRDAVSFADHIEVLLRDRALAAQLGAEALRTSAQYRWSVANGHLLKSYERVLTRFAA